MRPLRKLRASFPSPLHCIPAFMTVYIACDPYSYEGHESAEQVQLHSMNENAIHCIFTPVASYKLQRQKLNINVWQVR